VSTGESVDVTLMPLHPAKSAAATATTKSRMRCDYQESDGPTIPNACLDRPRLQNKLLSTFSFLLSNFFVPRRNRYLFVCINRRADDNPKGCCLAKGSEEVYQALKAEVAARGLNKLEARVCTSSCLDQCATGITVLVEPDHFFYGRVTLADVPEIVDGLIRGQRVERLVLTPGDLLRS